MHVIMEQSSHARLTAMPLVIPCWRSRRLMRGTLALWYEPVVKVPKTEEADVGVLAPEEVPQPCVELHFNLWRDLSSSTNSLDVGFVLSELSGLRRFYLYIPAPVRRTHIKDLAPVLRVGATLNAVFNEVVTLRAEGDSSYEIVPHCNPPLNVFFIGEQDLKVESFKEGDNFIGTRIAFTEALCSRLRDCLTNVYLRIRIELVGTAADLFSSEIFASDRAFASSIGRFELTEFRLNERRSYPPRIAELADRYDFNIRQLHYFLIRDLQHRLLVQHAPFRKVRRLERDLWADYLAGSTSAHQFKLSAKLASRLVIYHWRKDADAGSAIDGFIAFASFSASTHNIALYAAVIVLLGAAGSALAAAAAAYLGLHLPTLLSMKQNVDLEALRWAAKLNLWTAVLFAICVLGVLASIALFTLFAGWLSYIKRELTLWLRR